MTDYRKNGSAVGGAGLPVASGAGEVPLSTGAGTAYAAAIFVDEVGVAIASGIGSTLGQALIGDGAGDITLTSADVSALLAAATAAAARSALGVQDAPRTLPLCDFASVGAALTVVGRLRFDPALYAISGRTFTLTLESMADVSDVLTTGTITLRDLTGAVDVATLAVSSTTAGNVQTAGVTVPGVASSYELRAVVVGPGYLSLNAIVRITWS